MFYPKSKEKFSIKEFKNPDKTYRAAPFWAWNTELDKEELLRQIEIFKTMGFGGFHIHSRVGMATPYLSEEFFDLVLSCNEKGKQEDMLTYLYDEDRWPSGTAGGFVTKNEEYRQVYLKFRTQPLENGRAKLLAAYDVEFHDNNTVDYKKIGEKEVAEHQKWYAYIDREPEGNSWFNNQCYVDMLNEEAIAEFLRLTHGEYKKHLGDEFLKSVPSIFTDEPQLTRKNLFDDINDDFMLPWTDKFCERYIEKYGEDISDKIPEIFFEKSDGTYSYTRYNYHNLTNEMFAESFSDQYGKWCDDNGIAMTGHLLCEGDLIGQNMSTGDMLRHYLGFTMPGCDMLLNRHEYTTIKQANSISRQKGREGVLCELDGVTNWDFDFRMHKLHGDWQAALGVTLRVPHLSWVSMNGEAKRDYPATINYQAAWCDKYHVIEDYFGRVNTIITRGKADCKVAVLHPIRNVWLTMGMKQNTKEIVEKLNSDFLDLTDSLVKHHVDFDFIGEGNIALQNMHFANGKLVVENCEYDLLVVPQMLTLSADTIKLLKTAKQNGAKVALFGDAPKYVDGHLSDEPIQLYEALENKPYSIENIIKAVDEYRDYEVLENNARSDKYCGVLKIDGEDKWLFIAKAVDPDITESDTHNITIKIKGKYVPTEYCCVSGNVYKTNYEYCDGYTCVYMTVFAHDSITLRLSANEDENAVEKPSKVGEFSTKISDEVPFSLTEPNVYLIDKAEFKLDDGEFEPLDEILRIDNALRKRLGLKQKGDHIAQPWVENYRPKPEHTITLKCEINSKIEYEDAILAIEKPEECKILFNGKEINTNAIGWYVDKCIKKLELGTINKGVNTLEVTMPFGFNTETEYMYILGSFGVYDTKTPYIDELPKTLKFGNIADQGLLFYGGNVDYHLGNLNAEKIFVPYYKGGLIEVLSDNKEQGEIVYSPYTFSISGMNDITLRLYGTRINTFGQLHLVPHDNFRWYGSESWRTHGDEWTYDYLPWEQGILKTPIIM